MVVFSTFSGVGRIIATGLAAAAILGLAIVSAGSASAGQLKTSINPYLLPPWLGTWSGLYLTPKEAHSAAKRRGVVFVDVRYSEELKKDGSPKGLDGHVPWVRMAPLKIGGHTVYQPQINPNFIHELKSKVGSRGGALGRTPVVLISTTGERSARAADFLHKAGYREIYTVVYGFTGGDHPEDRAQSWRGVGLPYRGKSARASLQ